jgi:hypothetical protein
MPKGRIRHMFPGGNTSKGFFSYYNYIICQEDAQRIFIMKGGPGVGKSTFMKNTAAELVELGYDLEFMHCSSDNNSLDGIVVPRIGIAMIDGTAPHVVDPKNPGAVDEIIHLGDYWNEAGIRKNREKIVNENKEVGRLFARAYRYLKAASQLYEDNAVAYGWALDEAKINIIANDLLEEVFEGIPTAAKLGRQRCLFASAITPDGLKNYLDDLLLTENVYVLEGFPGAGTERLLERMKNAALERGFYVEAYYCALNPEKLEHLIIPSLDISFTTVNKYHKTDACVYRRIDFKEMLNKSMLSSYNGDLEYNQAEFDELLGKVVETIGRAKACHDIMEKYYIPNMDFEAIQRCWESTMVRILEYAAARK